MKIKQLLSFALLIFAMSGNTLMAQDDDSNNDKKGTYEGETDFNATLRRVVKFSPQEVKELAEKEIAVQMKANPSGKLFDIKIEGSFNDNIDTQIKNLLDTVRLRFSDQVRGMNDEFDASMGIHMSRSGYLYMVRINKAHYGTGNDGLMKHLSEVILPEVQAEVGKIEGQLGIQFYISKDGKLTNIEVERSSINPKALAPLVARLSSLASWRPARTENNSVASGVYLHMNITNQNGMIQVQEMKKTMCIVANGRYFSNIIADNTNIKIDKPWKLWDKRLITRINIDKTGNPLEVKVLKGINKQIDKEAVRILSQQRWIPAQIGGEDVATQEILAFRVSSKGKIYFTSETPTQYVGGYDALNAYIGKYVNSNPIMKAETQSTKAVRVSFTIDAQGRPMKFRILKGETDEINNEVLTMLKNMPYWIPATNNGIAVSVRTSTIVQFISYNKKK